MKIYSIEIRLRRHAKNKGLRFLKPRVRNKKDITFNTYQIILSTGETKHGLSLQESEEFILSYMPE